MEKQFEQAVRTKLRFETSRGSLTVEDLWDVDLLSSDGFDLDSIARGLSKTLKENNEESFVKPKTRSNSVLELKLDIVKHIITVKMAEDEERFQAAERKAKKARIVELLAQKQDQALADKSEDELRAMLDDLD